MRFIVVFIVLFALTFGKHCVPDKFKINFVGQVVYAAHHHHHKQAESKLDELIQNELKHGDGLLLMDQNETRWVDFNNSMVAVNEIIYLHGRSYSRLVIQDFSKMELIEIDFEREKCYKAELKENMPDQCLPDDVKFISNFTNIQGNEMSLFRYTDSNGQFVSVTMEQRGNTTVHILQTVAFRNRRGSGLATQLFGETASKFDSSIFDVPDFCEEN